MTSDHLPERAPDLRDASEAVPQPEAPRLDAEGEVERRPAGSARDALPRAADGGHPTADVLPRHPAPDRGAGHRAALPACLPPVAPQLMARDAASPRPDAPPDGDAPDRRAGGTGDDSITPASTPTPARATTGAKHPPAPDEGDRRPRPDEGERHPRPDEGDRRPRPDEGEHRPQADEGEHRPQADEGERRPRPDEASRPTASAAAGASLDPGMDRPAPAIGPDASEAWIAALTAAPGGADALAPLWRPRDLRPSDELAHVPFLFWLMAACRPRAVALQGLGSGVACHAVAQAAERLGLETAITAFARPGQPAALGPDYARAAEAAGAWHRVREVAPEAAPAHHRGEVDLLCVLGQPFAGHAAAPGEAWAGKLSPGGVILSLGASSDGAPPDGTWRMTQAGGLDVAAAGGAPPAALARLLADPEARARASDLFERLGAIWSEIATARRAAAQGATPGRAEALVEAIEAAQGRTAEAMAALEGRTRALGVAHQRVEAIETDHRLACARRDALWEALRAARREGDAAAAALRAKQRLHVEAERRAIELDGTLQAERRALAAADKADKAERRARAEARQRQAQEEARRAGGRRDPWEEARAAILAAELEGLRARRLGLRDLRQRMGQPSTRRQIALIRASALFDPAWYAARHPDLVARSRRTLDRLGLGSVKARLAAHYLRHGAAEGRDPGPGFGTRHYYCANPDAARGGWNALVHYELFGRAEGRAPAPPGSASIDLASDAALIEASNLFDAEWYAARHPDIAEGMRPSEHYLTLGAAAGHDPSPRFGTREYEEAYPDVEQAGLNPLVHYLRHGMAEGREARRVGRGGLRRRVETIRTQLLSLGFTEEPLEALAETVRGSDDPESRERAAVELGRWHLRRENGPDWAGALGWLDLAARGAPRDEARARIAVMRLACLHALERPEEARAVVEAARSEGYVTPGLLLGSSILEPTEAARIAVLNQAMRECGLPDLALREVGPGASLYDRLRTAGAPEPVTGGAVVSVIVAAYNAEATLPLTLTALREQTWRAHEVIVVDDASTDGTRAVAERFAAEDPRVRVLALDRNVGAYAARNRALAVARGSLVCLQDADDWAQATRLARQASHLAQNPHLIACTVQQARLRDDLTLAHWSAQGELIFACIASLMFRREPVRERLGGWDEVRFSADHEMIRRLHDAFSGASVASLATGPMILQRYSEGSATADLATGYSGAYSGARLEYFEAQRHHRKRGGTLRYEPGSRPFPVPMIMRPEARRGEARHHDVVIASELRMMGGSSQSCIEEIRAQRAAGLSTGLVKMYRYDLPLAGRVDTLASVRDEIDGEAVTMLAYGERATCDLLILRYPPVLRHPQRYLPQIEAGRVKVIVNQPPMSDYGAGGRRRYELDGAEANLRATFGKPGEWHPIGPLVRAALHEHHADQLGAIDLREDDWTNVIDLADWDRGLGGGPRAAAGRPLRIGRHARDNAVKWPASAAEILEVYPEADDVEVHVLGGAEAPASLIGRVPRNWRVAPFGSRAPRDFLAEIDVFVYYTHPAWVESFGRAIIEAMAAGVPVVLPPHYEPVFGAAATYAPPSGALAQARRLHADPIAYRAQALTARAMARARHGYARHVARLREAGVRGGAAEGTGR